MLQAVRQAPLASPRVLPQLHVETLVFQRVLHAFDGGANHWANVLKMLARRSMAQAPSSTGPPPLIDHALSVSVHVCVCVCVCLCLCLCVCVSLCICVSM